MKRYHLTARYRSELGILAAPCPKNLDLVRLSDLALADLGLAE
jgi:hypothetical protein